VERPGTARRLPQRLSARSGGATPEGEGLVEGAGKHSAAVMRSKGFMSSLLFCQIKTHLTSLLASTRPAPR
jgi:hypothetical protein